MNRDEIVSRLRNDDPYNIGLSGSAADEIERLQAILQAIVNEVESLHYGTDLFTSCAAGEADRLIELIKSEVNDE